MTLEQPGAFNDAEYSELVQRMTTAPSSVQASVQAEDGTVFFGTLEELNELNRLQSQIFKPHSN
ncbi:hypothetical protein [Spirosoma sp.]|uniref:hypothetical protein n=1 Tax=Spirosoma sp. TaxID=1899569 RepID=UPI003B3BAB7C